MLPVKKLVWSTDPISSNKYFDLAAILRLLLLKSIKACHSKPTVTYNPQGYKERLSSQVNAYTGAYGAIIRQALCPSHHFQSNLTHCICRLMDLISDIKCWCAFACMGGCVCVYVFSGVGGCGHQSGWEEWSGKITRDTLRINGSAGKQAGLEHTGNTDEKQ